MVELVTTSIFMDHNSIDMIPCFTYKDHQEADQRADLQTLHYICSNDLKNKNIFMIERISYSSPDVVIPLVINKI